MSGAIKPISMMPMSKVPTVIFAFIGWSSFIVVL
jgi:hypothetical protein